jgi:hypothetical protein
MAWSLACGRQGDVSSCSAEIGLLVGAGGLIMSRPSADFSACYCVGIPRRFLVLRRRAAGRLGTKRARIRLGRPSQWAIWASEGLSVHLTLDFKGAPVTIESVFYAQIGSVVAFIVSLFVLYRQLVSFKDATIETLKQQVAFLDAKVKASAEAAPDVLIQRFEKRTTLLEKELEAAEKEKEPLTAEIEDLKRKIAAPDSQAQQQALVNQLVAVSQHVALLNMERQQLVLRLNEVEQPYRQFLHHANGELSPGRRQIVGEIVTHFGVERVIASKPEDLIAEFAQLAAETRASGMHPNVRINGGAFTGLRSVGLINDRDELTLVGVSVFKSIARELKSRHSVERTLGA